jgi:methionine synthase I (cobalamin-dependent)
MDTNLPEALRSAAGGRFLVGPGPMGSELVRLGHGHLIADGWAGPNLSAAGRMATREVHGELLDAGADMVATNTFRGTETPVRQYLENLHLDTSNVSEVVRKITADACSDVHGAVDAANLERPILVVGSMGPVHDSDSPWLADETPFDDLFREHEGHVRRLLEGDEHGRSVGALLCETVASVKELEAMGAAVEAHDNFPYIVALYPSPDGKKLFGSDVPITRAAETVLRLDHKPAVIGANHAGRRGVVGALKEIRAVDTSIPLVAYAGSGESSWRWLKANRAPDVDAMKQCVDLGAVMVGGCCGITPDHIKDIVAWRNSR